MNRLITAYMLVCCAVFFLPSPGKSATLTMIPDPQGTASISGYVVDSTTKETLISATVSIKGTKLGAFTNKSGFYSVKSIPAGKQTVVISMVGYSRKEVTLTFGEKESKTITFSMQPQDMQTEGVVVEGDRDIEKREITISKVNIPIEQLSQLRIGGESDIFRSLQYLPGILTSSQISSGLYVRGGSPDQNLVLIDGSTVYNPSHLFGFISAFNTDAIKDVELIKGGFPAEYGGRLSSVLTLTQKDGNQNEFEGVASLGAISSRLSLEGPIGDGSWFIGGRRTYLDLIIGLLPDDPENPLPNFAFYDLNAKISQNLGSNDKIFISGFMSDDDLSLKGTGVEFNVGLGNRTGAARWTHIFSEDLFSVVNLSASRYKNGFDANNAGFEVEASNSILDYTLKANLEWFASDVLTVKGGTEINRFTFNYYQNFTGDRDSTSPTGSTGRGTTNLEINDWTYSLFAQGNYQFSDLVSMQAGLRGDYWKLSEIGTVDPRLALRYQWQPDVAFKAAWGIYHQYLRLASNPDFSFFDTWLPTDSTVQPSRASHYIFSVETMPFDGYDFNVDLYYKDLTNISELNRFSTNAANVTDVFFSGNGEAYGVEFFLQKKKGRLTGWLGYALGWVYSTFDSINGGARFRPKYDRLHDFKAVALYRLNDTWEIGASFSFQSGQSYTAMTSWYQTSLPGESTDAGLSVPGQRYGYRLPPSHQLNLNVNYNFTVFDLPARLLLDIYNVYSRRDIWFRYYDTTKERPTVTDVRLLPILPTVSFEVKF